MFRYLKELWMVISLSASATAVSEPNWFNYSTETKKFRNINPDIPLNFGPVEFTKILYEVFFNSKARRPAVALPEVKPDIREFMQSPDPFQFIWLGHSSLLLRIDQRNIHVDPVFSEYASPNRFINKRFQAPVISLNDLPDIDAIVISHDHYDHLDEETVRYFASKANKFIVPLKVGGLLKDWGIPEDRIVELNWNDSYQLDSVRLTATVAHHNSARGLFDKNETLWSSWVFEGGGHKVFYSGDSAYKDHFKKIGDQYGPFNFAFVENGQYNLKWPDAHMQPEETIQAVMDLRAEFFIPVHWGMFDLSLHDWAEPVERSSFLAKEKGIRMLSPILGQAMQSQSLPEFHPWWERVKEEEARIKGR